MHKKQSVDTGKLQSDPITPHGYDNPANVSPRFLLLGPVALTDGREAIVLQPSKPASLLAALLLHPNSVVSADFLRQVVWGEAGPGVPRSALHTCVQRLRQLFAKYGLSGHLIDSVSGGYRITADARSLDLIAFRDLARQAEAQADPGDELRLLRAALSLWQGPVLSNVHSDTLHREIVPRLAEERLRAIERVFDIELGLGRYRQVIAELWPTARAHPAHERLWAQLIEALHRTGRRADALAEYRTVKDYLRAELGVDPGPVLRRLEMAVLRGDELAAAGSRRPAALGAGPAAAGGTPGAAAGPPRPPAAADRVLGALVDAGLLEEGPSGFYSMHDSLRMLARGAAAIHGEESGSAPPFDG
ncbi:AfsR/SARP family transcriptional regulator [Streptantibioticus silvisoli]|uniref:AfsR/SARP family transcriptional regulator n=1 Tax=Streptantibioticus silvisoli TaxID=2705255 RepID=UPI003556B1E4